MIHHDVKSSSFLVFPHAFDKYPTVKLCDLGVAVAQRDECKTTLIQQPGATQYFAPEIHKGRPHSSASDVFSFGVVACDSITKSPPYALFATPFEMMILKMGGFMPCQIPGGCPTPLKSLIE